MFESDAHTVTVLPIPAPPDDYPNAVWLPARDLQLSEEWSREPDRIDAGEPITRRVTVNALGQIETQLPAVELPEVEGLNVYADKPELSRRIEDNGIRGVRKDQYAIIGVQGGDIALPAVEIPWWNIDEGAWQVATLAGRTIRINAPAQPATAAPVRETPVTDGPAASPEQRLLPDLFWQRTTQLLAALWLLTVVAWWWSARDVRRKPREPASPPLYKQQAKWLKAARKAALSGDDHGVRDALLAWGRLQWPSDAPRSIGIMAERVAAPLADELRKLSMASYGPADRDWDGQALAKSLKSITAIRDERVDEKADPLPTLRPSA